MHEIDMSYRKNTRRGALEYLQRMCMVKVFSSIA